jgi:hypothetical protein
MHLSKMDRVDGVEANQAPQKVITDLCRALFDTQKKLMEVNNECVELRHELEEIKRKMK